MGDDEAKVHFGRDFDNWMQAQRLQAQLEERDFPKFSLCLNLGDIPPENVKLSITDRVITVSGYLKEVAEDEDGMIRETFHGFSNEFGLPEGFDPLTVRVKDNHDQSITIEADYSIPYDHHREEEVSCPLSGRPSSVPSAHSQREQAISHHDALKSPLILPTSTNSPPTSPSSTRRPSIVPATFNVSATFPPSQMKFLRNATLSSPNITSQMPSQFNVPAPFGPCQANNLPSAMGYTENNPLAAPPQFVTSEMNVVRSTVGPLPESHAATFSQFNTSSSVRQASADASTDMQCKLNYSSPANQAVQSTVGLPPDRNSVVFSEFPPAPQLTPCQMKAPQHTQSTSADNGHGVLYRRTSLFTPCQKKAQQSSQPNVLENIYRDETYPSKIRHEVAVPPAPCHIGKRNSIEIPSSNSHKNLDVPCLVNRSFLKPGTRCETHPSIASPKHDYKVPGSRRLHFAQNRGESKMESRSHSFLNVSVMKNGNSQAHINKTT